MTQPSQIDESLLINETYCTVIEAEGVKQPDKPATPNQTWATYLECMKCCCYPDIDHTTETTYTPPQETLTRPDHIESSVNNQTIEREVQHQTQHLTPPKTSSQTPSRSPREWSLEFNEASDKPISRVNSTSSLGALSDLDHDNTPEKPDKRSLMSRF
ncbi:MAG: hypothetical protein VXY77_04725 [Pseudomonadota bacterium]|nr:hypothetical protein [Pseudomonadota bacterium]